MKRKLTKLLSLLLALVALGGLLSGCGGKAEYSYLPGMTELYCYYTSPAPYGIPNRYAEGASLDLTDGGLLLVRHDQLILLESRDDIGYSDREAACFVSGDGWYYFLAYSREDGSYPLYYAPTADAEPEVIAVLAESNYGFTANELGCFFVNVTDSGQHSLFFYDRTSGKTVELGEHDGFGFYSSDLLSIVYRSKDEIYTYVSGEDAPRNMGTVGTNAVPLTVSGDGKRVIYASGEETYLLERGVSTLLGSFHSTHSTAQFLENGRGYYVFDSKSDRFLLSLDGNAAAEYRLPERLSLYNIPLLSSYTDKRGAEQYLVWLANWRTPDLSGWYRLSEDGECVPLCDLPVTDCCGIAGGVLYFMSGDSLCSLDLNGDGTATVIETGVDNALLSKDQAALYYVKDETLYRCPADNVIWPEKVLEHCNATFNFSGESGFYARCRESDSEDSDRLLYYCDGLTSPRLLFQSQHIVAMYDHGYVYCLYTYEDGSGTRNFYTLHDGVCTLELENSDLRWADGCIIG